MVSTLSIGIISKLFSLFHVRQSPLNIAQFPPLIFVYIPYFKRTSPHLFSHPQHIVWHTIRTRRKVYRCMWISGNYKLSLCLSYFYLRYLLFQLSFVTRLRSWRVVLRKNVTSLSNKFTLRYIRNKLWSYMVKLNSMVNDVSHSNFLNTTRLEQCSCTLFWLHFFVLYRENPFSVDLVD